MGKNTITPNRSKRAMKRTKAEVNVAADQTIESCLVAAEIERQRVVDTLTKSPDWSKVNRFQEEPRAPSPISQPIRVTLVVEYEDFASLADGAAELHDEAKHFGDLVSMKVSIPGGDYDWKA